MRVSMHMLPASLYDSVPISHVPFFRTGVCLLYSHVCLYERFSCPGLWLVHEASFISAPFSAGNLKELSKCIDHSSDSFHQPAASRSSFDVPPLCDRESIRVEHDATSAHYPGVRRGEGVAPIQP